MSCYTYIINQVSRTNPASLIVVEYFSTRMAYQGQTILCLNKMSLKVTVMLLLTCVPGTQLQGELPLFFKLY